MSERKIIYLGFAFSHHRNTHAGYDKISDFLAYNKKINCQQYIENCASKKLFRRIIHKLCNVLFHIPEIPFYLLKVIQIGCISKNNVFHFIYGENIFFRLPKWLLRKENKYVCTFHQPFEWFEHNPRFLNYLKELDAVILVGKSELEKFECVTGRKNVFFIPHGICTDFYRPEESIHKEHMLLTVGNWLRDYDFADRVYQRLLIEDPSLVINVVASEKNQQKIKKHSRILFHNGISDERLKKLYCQCSVLFLPLIRYTANNAVLEAGATGCNLVIASNYPDNSYIPEEYISVTEMDVDKTILAIKAALRPKYNYGLSAYVQKYFSWTEIAKQTSDVLKKI